MYQLFLHFLGLWYNSKDSDSGHLLTVPASMHGNCTSRVVMYLVAQHLRFQRQTFKHLPVLLCYIFLAFRVCWPLLCLCRPFCILERCLEWIRIQRAALAIRRATNLITHLPPIIYSCPKICLSLRNIEQSEMEMLRKTMGLAMPLKLQMERNAAKKVRTGYSLDDNLVFLHCSGSVTFY